MPEPYEMYPKRSSPTAVSNTDSQAQAPLEIGMMGFSIEDVNQGERGLFWMPLGARDATKWGGRKYIKVKLTALENVRGRRDVIVATEQGDVKEHTPVELSYEKRVGGYQRAGETKPLPVTMGSRIDVTYVTVECTTLGDNEIVVADANKRIFIHYFSFANRDVIAANVGLRFSSETAKHMFSLVASGGAVNANLTDAPFVSLVGAALYAYLVEAHAAATPVYVTVGYIQE